MAYRNRKIGRRVPKRTKQELMNDEQLQLKILEALDGQHGRSSVGRVLMELFEETGPHQQFNTWINLIDGTWRLVQRDDQQKTHPVLSEKGRARLAELRKKYRE